MRAKLWFSCSLVTAFAVLIAGTDRPAPAYIGGPPATLGMMCSWSTHLVSVRVERVDREKGLIVFRKIADLKGKWPAEVIRHVLPQGMPERQRIFEWAEVGKTTMMFALDSYRWSHTYIDSMWYASNTNDWQWWNVSHGEPVLLRTYSGKSDRLVSAAGTILANKEVIVPCLTDGSPEELSKKKTKVQRMRASLKLQDYNPKRDFAGWGGDDFTAIAGMPGFSHLCALCRVDPEAQIVSCIDFTDDGKLDLCLAGPGKVVLMQNSGDYWTELALPGTPTGCRAAVWADYNGDGLPDLLLATPNGPRLFANLGSGNFRDASALLPKETSCNLTAAAWIDFDSDGLPDILLATGFDGLRLLRNRGLAETKVARLRPGQALPPPEELPFEDISARVGLGSDGVGSNVKGDTLTVCDVNGDGRPDVLYGAGSGMLLLNTRGFVESRYSGIVYKPGKVGPIFGDFDGDGHPDLFVPQLDGRCKLFRNDGKGIFTDVTAQAGDLARPLGNATCATWGDFDNDGTLDLVVGCLRGPNRYFRNGGDGKFCEATEEIGLTHRLYNTQAVALADLNNDGTLDMIFVNEGQDSLVLLGSPASPRMELVSQEAEQVVPPVRTPLALHVVGPLGVIGSHVRLFDAQGKCLASQFLTGGESRGSQSAPVARFVVPPGKYRAVVRFSSGFVQTKEITVRDRPMRVTIDDEMPPVK